MHWHRKLSAVGSSVAGRCAACATRSVCIGAGLEPAALTQLQGIFSASEALAPGAHLYRPGDRADCQFHVRSGSFKTYVINAEGEERVTGFYLPGEMLSNTQVDGLREDGAIALETASACRLQIADVEQLQDIARLPALLIKLSERETQLCKHQLNLAGTAAQARFVSFCLQYSARLARLGRSATVLPLPMSRSDIASYLGMTLESLSRIAAKLVKVGLIRSTRSELELLDVETLETLAVQGTY